MFIMQQIQSVTAKQIANCNEILKPLSGSENDMIVLSEPVASFRHCRILS